MWNLKEKETLKKTRVKWWLSGDGNWGDKIDGVKGHKLVTNTKIAIKI